MTDLCFRMIRVCCSRGSGLRDSSSGAIAMMKTRDDEALDGRTGGGRRGKGNTPLTSLRLGC